VTASAALGKLQSVNILATPLGNELSSSPENISSSDLTSDGEQKPNTGRLYHSPGDSIVQDPELQSSQATSLLKNPDFKALMMFQDDRVCGKSYIL
jgi:hypothetical protein